MAEKNIEMKRKKADGTFDSYYPLTKETNILADAGSLVLIRTNGLLTQVDELVGAVLRKRAVLTRSNGLLTSITTSLYAGDGTTVVSQWTETLNRIDGSLSSITKAVIV